MLFQTRFTSTCVHMHTRTRTNIHTHTHTLAHTHAQGDLSITVPPHGSASSQQQARRSSPSPRLLHLDYSTTANTGTLCSDSKQYLDHPYSFVQKPSLSPLVILTFSGGEELYDPQYLVGFFSILT